MLRGWVLVFWFYWFILSCCGFWGNKFGVYYVLVLMLVCRVYGFCVKKGYGRENGYFKVYES